MVALRTFVTVARYCSMKRAGEILCISLGAVSQQIKGLEERLGRRLFQRSAQGIQLTSSGQTMYEHLAAAIGSIEDLWSVALGESSRHARLVIGMPTSIALSWLIPRLNDLHDKWPGIEISIAASSTASELKDSRVDVAVVDNAVEDSAHRVTPLFYCDLIPVCSPSLLASGPEIHAPRDCLASPLLHDRYRQTWKRWLSENGCSSPHVADGTSYYDEALLIRAACAGQGIALVSEVLVAGELSTGKLVQVIKTSSPIRIGYHVVVANERANEWAINAFCGWVVEQAADPFGRVPTLDAINTP